MPSRYVFTSTLGKIFHLTRFTGILYEALRVALGRSRGVVMKQLATYDLPQYPLLRRAVSTNGQSILMFAYLPCWLKVCVPIAAVLGQKGYDVRLVLLPYNRFDKEEVWYQRIYDNLTYKELSSLNLPNVTITMLRMRSNNISPEVEKEVIEQAILDTCYISKTDRFDSNNPLHLQVFRFRYRRNRDASVAFNTLLGERDFDKILVPNGTILEFGAVYRIANLRQLPCATFEFLSNRGEIIISNTSPVIDFETDEAWMKYHLQSKSSTVYTRVLKQVRDRSLAKQASSDSYQVVDPQDSSIVEKALGLYENRRTALLCTNVVWDSAALGRGVFFSGTREWVEKTVQWFANRNDWQLIVRVHPAERLIGTEEPVASIVHEARPQACHNIFIVDADAPINTYSLIELSDIGLVYTSTVGIEMTVLGLPTICVGHSHYRGKAFTIDPESEEEYFALLAQFSSGELKRADLSASELAAQYLDFWTEWPWPFPWHIATIDFDIAEWPVPRLLSREGQARFGEVWRLLADDKKNYEQTKQCSFLSTTGLPT